MQASKTKRPPRPLSAERLREILTYDPLSGAFAWNRSRRGRSSPDGLAGWIDGGGYRRLQIEGERYYSGPLAVLYMTGEWPPEDVDHINRDRADDRWSNLRLASRSQNQVNRVLPRRERDLPRGVRFTANGFEASIRRDGLYRYLGRFPSAEEASIAYQRAAAAHHGEYLP